MSNLEEPLILSKAWLLNESCWASSQSGEKSWWTLFYLALSTYIDEDTLLELAARRHKDYRHISPGFRYRSSYTSMVVRSTCALVLLRLLRPLSSVIERRTCPAILTQA